MFLERFLDSNNKFEFSTYEVKDTSENKTAIDLNGDVRIEFYNEQTYVPNYPNFSNGSWNTSWGSITTGSPYFSGGVTFTTSGVNGFAYVSNTSSLSNNIETGRIEKGEKSKQQFTNSYENFEYLASRQIIYKILPLGIKNKTTEEIKYYCTECGTKTKSKYKFCPTCGNKL